MKKTLNNDSDNNEEDFNRIISINFNGGNFYNLTFNYNNVSNSEDCAFSESPHGVLTEKGESMTDLKERIFNLFEIMNLWHTGRQIYLMIVLRDEGLIDNNNVMGFVKLLKQWNLDPCCYSALNKWMKKLPDNGKSNYQSWASISWAHEPYETCLTIKKNLFEL